MLTTILGALPTLEPADRKAVGGAANALKRELEAAFAARERELARAARAGGSVDLTMPGRPAWQGGLHLVTQVVDEICEQLKDPALARIPVVVMSASDDGEVSAHGHVGKPFDIEELLGVVARLAPESSTLH